MPKIKKTKLDRTIFKPFISLLTPNPYHYSEVSTLYDISITRFFKIVLGGAPGDLAKLDSLHDTEHWTMKESLLGLHKGSYHKYWSISCGHFDVGLGC